MVFVPFEKSSASVFRPLERPCRDEALAKARRNSRKVLVEIISLATYVQNVYIEDGPIRDLHSCNGKGTSCRKSGQRKTDISKDHTVKGRAQSVVQKNYELS